MLEVSDGAVRHIPRQRDRRPLWPAARLRGEGTAARRAWRSRYVRRLVALDVASAIAAGVLGQIAETQPVSGSMDLVGSLVTVLVIFPLLWAGAMLVARAYEERFLWIGAEEFRRVFFAAAMLLATIGTVSWAFRLELARGFAIVALPVALLLTMGHRMAQRSWLHGERRHGKFQQTAIIVGHRGGVAALHAQLDRAKEHGYQVIGCCVPAGGSSDTFDGLPVLGSLDSVVDVVRAYEVDTVAVLPCPELDGSALRQLGWDLEDTQAELLLAPAVTEVAGPRVRIRPVAGLPLMHVERPEFTGHRRIVKNVFDRSAALFGILLISPVLVVLALAVKLTSRGPVFYKHERIGQGGQPFEVYKFRSMVPDADKLVDTLFEESNEGNDVQFKMKRDPRVTRVGAVMRRYSLDELPQLFNVLNGSMSLVGPRPHVTREVEQYGFDMRRRLLVKPGITGLWQVSGRSDLSWDDSVRIDVRYVENWTLSFDLMILWKTVGAVLRGSGAY
ncbi:sugar transferase [Blastococcus sp. MG754426]|nr:MULTISPECIES: sugar transferase [unclassified Blastococcus]MCF6508458.1 sugar transferase [Blastococcus sp. MG754426]MCF6513459.1 sugar transferase [Blastococcus sp. MG754427]